MKRTHEYSCILDSFAFVCGVEPETLMREIGHCGTGKGEPRGFHSQEIIEPILARGFWITQIELFPVAQDPLNHEQRLVHFTDKSESNWHRFAKHLQGNHGVLSGFNAKKIPHSVAWINSLVHDPVGKSYPLLELRNDIAIGIKHGQPFIPSLFWKVKP